MQRTRPSAAPSFPVALSDVRENTASSSGGSVRASATRRPPATCLCLVTERHYSSQPRKAVVARVTGVSLNDLFRFGWRVARRTANCSPPRVLHSVFGFAGSVLRRGSRGRVLGTSLGRVLMQRPPRLDPGVVSMPSPSLPSRARANKSIRQERARVFTSSVSYNSSALSTTPCEQLCSKSSDSPAAPSQPHTTRLQNKHEPCVASSRSQPSQAPRPTLG